MWILYFVMCICLYKYMFKIMQTINDELVFDFLYTHFRTQLMKRLWSCYSLT